MFRVGISVCLCVCVCVCLTGQVGGGGGTQRWQRGSACQAPTIILSPPLLHYSFLGRHLKHEAAALIKKKKKKNLFPPLASLEKSWNLMTSTHTHTHTHTHTRTHALTLVMIASGWTGQTDAVPSGEKDRVTSTVLPACCACGCESVCGCLCVKLWQRLQALQVLQQPQRRYITHLKWPANSSALPGTCSPVPSSLSLSLSLSLSVSPTHTRTVTSGTLHLLYDTHVTRCL